MSLVQVSDKQLSEAIKKITALIPRLNLEELLKLEASVTHVMKHKTSVARSSAILALVLKWQVAVHNAMRYDYVKEID